MSDDDLSALHGVMLELLAQHQPSHWTLNYIQDVSLKGRVIELRGALPSTMHMGVARLTLDTADLVFVDEDSRDAYDTEDKRVTLSTEELARVLLVIPPRRRVTIVR